MQSISGTAAVVRRGVFALVLAGGIGGAGFQAALAQSEEDAAAKPKAASATIVEQHALAQQGLSIGLAAGFVQSQLAILGANTAKIGKCFTVPGGGGLKTLQASFVGNNGKLTIELYYDKTCNDRYLNARVDATKQSSTVLAMSEMATLYGPSGKTLGKLKLAGSVTFFSGGNIDHLSATGTLTPAGLGAVDIGLDCGLPSFSVPTATIPCHVGIAQTLTAVGGDVASVTPITVKVKRNSNTATFTANNAQLTRGVSGKLGITAPTNHSLKITGAHTAVGKASGTGTLAVFSVFPKGPSSWVSTDTGNNARFSIVMAKGAKTLKGTIKKLNSGATLATFTVDASGTGSIVYSNKKKAAVTSWILAN